MVFKVKTFKLPKTEEWCIVPSGYTMEELIRSYNAVGLTKCRQFMYPFLVQEKDRDFDVLKATSIVKQYSDESDIDFDLYKLE